MSGRRGRIRPRSACPACGLEVSFSHADPLLGPVVWRRHHRPDTGERCLEDGRDPRRPLTWEHR